MCIIFVIHIISLENDTTDLKKQIELLSSKQIVKDESVHPDIITYSGEFRKKNDSIATLFRSEHMYEYSHEVYKLSENGRYYPVK